MVWSDMFTGTLCILISLSFAALHIMTSHKHRIWPNVPEYVRIGFLATTCGMLARGLDFFRLSTPVGDGAQGHIDTVGLIVTVMMAYTMFGLAFSIFRRAYPAAVWAGMNHVEGLAEADPSGTLARLSMRGVRVVPPNGTVLPPG